MNQQNLPGFIWAVADLLRGDIKRSPDDLFDEMAEDLESALITLEMLMLKSPNSTV